MFPVLITNYSFLAHSTVVLVVIANCYHKIFFDRNRVVFI